MNDEMMMKGGVEQSAHPSIERMLNVFDLHLSAPEEKAVSRICASKTRSNLQTLAGAYNSNSHARGLHYLTFELRKQAEKSMQWGESFSGKCLRKAQHYRSSFEGVETLAI